MQPTTRSGERGLELSRRRRFLVLGICCASVLVVEMDISIVNVALPTIRRDLATMFPDPRERARAIGVFGSVTGLALALGPILGGALVDGFGWHSIFWINVPIVAAAIVCTALFVPESRAARARRFDPVGQTLMILMLGSVVYAIIESHKLGWTSPIILGLLAVAVLSALGIVGYEPRRTDPLLELRLFRSVPFSSAILMALFALCAFGAFLFVTTQYLQDVRGMSALTAGLSLLPVGVLIVVLSPITGRLVGTRGPRLPLVISGTALALGGAVSIWLGPTTPLPALHSQPRRTGCGGWCSPSASAS